ncbi:hypothetical protein [Mycobacterium haemophilum]|uniref:Uncharacterized protein n=1 Tax=Mycobacterium haemophilum TaxID=29311 RepID=A0A0I9U982_9MYCO|nr:hypothetical protein [Mycobacterium haemophilum]KLO30730.1 hypothetical protein ABH39_10215 [Mycobacterium haemophilum]KLO37773.1 hypothetical protein ABH38_07425 [Mycobacterium haemophilum]KLO43146.1 hypothetical protein ABH37_07660 [Mycobacterium haemophilum]KLO55595.1 hypothetical protein ABH36_06380 [Mycobacterium haemophilum]
MTSAGTSKRARTPVPPGLVVIGKPGGMTHDVVALAFPSREVDHRQAIALMVDDGQTARSVAVFAVP